MKTNVLIKIFAPVILAMMFVGTASAADVKVAVKYKVHLDHLHPDVDKIMTNCYFYDKKNNYLSEKANGRCDNFSSDPAVDSNRSVNRTLESCLTFDEDVALKIQWDRYHCWVRFHNSKEDVWGDPSTSNSREWLRVKPGAVLSADGKFDMYAK